MDFSFGRSSAPIGSCVRDRLSFTSMPGIALRIIRDEVLRGLLHQAQEVPDDGRRIAATRDEVENNPWLDATAEGSVDHAIDVHLLQRSRNKGDAYAGCDESQERCDARGFLADAGTETCGIAFHPCRILETSACAPVNDESFGCEALKRQR